MKQRRKESYNKLQKEKTILENKRWKENRKRVMKEENKVMRESYICIYINKCIFIAMYQHTHFVYILTSLLQCQHTVLYIYIYIYIHTHSFLSTHTNFHCYLSEKQKKYIYIYIYTHTHIFVI